MNSKLIRQFYQDVEKGMSHVEFLTYCNRIQDDILDLPDDVYRKEVQRLLSAIACSGWSELEETKGQNKRVLPPINALLVFVEKEQDSNELKPRPD